MNKKNANQEVQNSEHSTQRIEMKILIAQHKTKIAKEKDNNNG